MPATQSRISEKDRKKDPSVFEAGIRQAQKRRDAKLKRLWERLPAGAQAALLYPREVKVPVKLTRKRLEKHIERYEEQSRRLCEEFEEALGKIAIEFVQASSPFAWQKADWLWEAIDDWYGADSGTTKRKNLEEVTATMGKGIHANPDHQKLRRKRAAENSKKVVRWETLEVALTSYAYFLPICHRFKQFASEFRGERQMLLLSEWVIEGKRPQQIGEDGTIESESQDVVRVPLPELLERLNMSLEAFEWDFHEIRGVFGAKPQRILVDEGWQAQYCFSPDDRDGKAVLTEFVQNVIEKNLRPKRMAVNLAARRHGLAIRQIEKFMAARNRSASRTRLGPPGARVHEPQNS